VLCIVSGLVVVLARQAAELRETLQARAAQPRVVDWVPPYSVARLDGTPLTLGGSTTTQPLYFFHPHCPHCIASEAAISRIAARLRGLPSLQCVGISAASDGELDADRRTSPGALPLAHRDAKKMLSLFRISALPTLLLVDREGIYGTQAKSWEDGVPQLLQTIDGALAVRRGIGGFNQEDT